ncbi:hypothetical protein [Chitinophaga solisilvae]|nr:hypothetical protein [Chitinophaga solisilvae]
MIKHGGCRYNGEVQTKYYKTGKRNRTMSLAGYALLFRIHCRNQLH